MPTPTQVLVPLFDVSAGAADAVAGALPEPARTIVRFVGAALKFGSDLARNGVDPLTHIERMHAMSEAVAGVESAWKSALDERFPEKTGREEG